MVYISLMFQPEHYRLLSCSYNMLVERSTDIHNQAAVLQYFNYEYIELSPGSLLLDGGYITNYDSAAWKHQQPLKIVKSLFSSLKLEEG